MAVVTIDRLSKRYDGGGEPAVKDVSLTVADGEFMVLLGPSGCGKSSVLRMIAGLEPITSGTVAIDGRSINHVPAKERDIAMVFQSYALYPHMTVHDNLAFGLRRREACRARRSTGACASVAEKLGLAPFLARKPHALSGGQRQRVALGRAIVRDPKVFLFDEPLSNLDAALRVTTRNELIKQQHELGTTTIYVTHDQVEAMTMGDRICIMNKGEVVQIGTPLEVYRNPADTFVARFLGNPPMNLLAGRLERRECRAVLLDGGMQLRAPRLFARRARPLCRRAGDGRHAAGGSLRGAAGAGLGRGCRRCTARILAVEPLGAETLLMLAVGNSGEEIIARIGRDTMLRHGEEARLFLDRTAIHLFDPATTKAIARSPEGTAMKDSGIVDCHAHIIDHGRFPFRPGLGYTPRPEESGTREALAAMLDAHGVGARAAGPAERLRLRQLGDARCDGAAPGRFKAIAVISREDSRPGARGRWPTGAWSASASISSATIPPPWPARHGALARRGSRTWTGSPRSSPGRAMAAAGAAASAKRRQGPGRSFRRPRSRRRPRGTRLPGGAGAGAQRPRRGQALRPLPDSPPGPIASASSTGFVEALLAAFGKERCVWGSDWPFLGLSHDIRYGDALAALERWLPDAADRDLVLRRNPARLFGFAA